MKTVIITDKKIETKYFKGVPIYNTNEFTIQPCLGCSSCWIKTPQKCIHKDAMSIIVNDFAQSDLLICITKVKYGCYNIPIKRLLDRLQPMQQPFMRVYKGEIHHKPRNAKMKKAIILAYGDISKNEKELFDKLVKRNMLNYLYESIDLQFCTENEIQVLFNKRGENSNV